jgi:hypothetical protein
MLFAVAVGVVCISLSVDGDAILVAKPKQKIIHGAAVAAGTSLPGLPIECVDPATGATFEYKGRHLFANGSIDGNWLPDSTQRHVGSANGPARNSIPDGNGGSYLAWVDSRTGDSDIYLQHLNAAGDTCAGWHPGGLAVCSAQYSQYNLDACADGVGGVLLAWQDFRSGKSSVVYLQRINASGVPPDGWPAQGIALGGDQTQQFSPHVALDGSGGALVFWQQRGKPGLALRAQHVSGIGAVASGWPETGAELIPETQSVNGICAVGDGAGNVTLFCRYNPDSTGGRLVSARLHANSVPDSSWSLQALTLADHVGVESDPTILPNVDGGLLVAWTESSSGSTALKLVRLSSVGNVASGWSPSGKTIVSSGAGLSTPAVLPDGTGGAIVAWEDRRSGTGHISAQRLHGDGSTDSLWTQGIVVCNSPGEQHAPMLSSDGNGGVIASWVDDGIQNAMEGMSVTRAFLDALPQFLRSETNSGYAKLIWTGGAETGVTFHVYRSTASGELVLLGTPAVGDSSHLVLEDRAAPEGAVAEYKLSLETEDLEYFMEPVRVLIPLDPTALLLQRAWPTAGHDGLQIAFALPKGPPARVELLDVMGRRMTSETLSEFTPGYHTARVPFSTPVPSGIYFVRLSQGSKSSVRKLVFIR